MLWHRRAVFTSLRLSQGENGDLLGSVLPQYLRGPQMVHYASALIPHAAGAHRSGIIDQLGCSPGNHYGGGLAYSIAPNTAAVNPTWTISSATTIGLATSMVGFLAEASVSSPVRHTVTGGE